VVLSVFLENVVYSFYPTELSRNNSSIWLV